MVVMMVADGDEYAQLIASLVWLELGLVEISLGMRTGG
jgi:hypothetical protein